MHETPAETPAVQYPAPSVDSAVTRAGSLDPPAF